MKKFKIEITESLKQECPRFGSAHFKNGFKKFFPYVDVDHPEDLQGYFYSGAEKSFLSDCDGNVILPKLQVENLKDLTEGDRVLPLTKEHLLVFTSYYRSFLDGSFTSETDTTDRYSYQLYNMYNDSNIVLNLSKDFNHEVILKQLDMLDEIFINEDLDEEELNIFFAYLFKPSYVYNHIEIFYILLDFHKYIKDQPVEKRSELYKLVKIDFEKYQALRVLEHDLFNNFGRVNMNELKRNLENTLQPQIVYALLEDDDLLKAIFKKAKNQFDVILSFFSLSLFNTLVINDEDRADFSLKDYLIGLFSSKLSMKEINSLLSSGRIVVSVNEDSFEEPPAKEEDFFNSVSRYFKIF